MEITITTPALLFPAISLLLLAFTNRFLVLAQLVRSLHKDNKEHPERVTHMQIENLKTRLHLIRYMQVFGVSSFLICSFSMFSLFLNVLVLGEVFLGIALVSLIGALVLSLWEIAISTRALRYELADMVEQNCHQE